MARGRKTGGRDFEPGNKMGKGSNPIPADIKSARALNYAEFQRITNKYIHMGREELAVSIRDASTPALELLIASIIHKAITTGDQHRADFLLNRLIGKVPDKIETKQQIEIASLSNEQQKELVRQAIEVLSKEEDSHD